METYNICFYLRYLSYETCRSYHKKRLIKNCLCLQIPVLYRFPFQFTFFWLAAASSPEHLVSFLISNIHKQKGAVLGWLLLTNRFVFGTI